MGKYLDCKNGYKKEDLKIVSNLIQNGEIVILPTDTVYGISCDGLNPNAIRRVFEIKNRDFKNPINLLVSDLNMIKSITTNITDLEYTLITTFMPGPFTLILPKEKIVPNILTSNSPFVGVRIPNDKIILEIIKMINRPLATTSANISGKLSSTDVTDIFQDFNNQVSYIVDNGTSNIGIESTVVKVENNIPIILRRGYVLEEDIKKISTLTITNTSLSPSSKLSHYIVDSKSNNKDTLIDELSFMLVYSNNNMKMINYISNNIMDKDIGLVICCDEHKEIYQKNEISNILTYGKKDDYIDISKRLFHTLYQISQFKCKKIYIEGLKKEGLGITLMDKLINVCKNSYIEI